MALEGVMSYVTDPRVDAYIDALPEWQQAICRAGPGPRPRGRPGRRRDDQANGPALLRARRQHLCAAGRARTTSTSSCTTAPSCPIPRASSPPVTTTRRRARWRSTRASRSTPGPRRDVQPDHRQQPRRRLAQDEARHLTRRGGRGHRPGSDRASGRAQNAPAQARGSSCHGSRTGPRVWGPREGRHHRTSTVKSGSDARGPRTWVVVGHAAVGRRHAPACASLDTRTSVPRISAHDQTRTSSSPRTRVRRPPPGRIPGR